MENVEMPEHDLHQDRRVDLVTVKVATLEERSVSTAASLARIEKTVEDHVKEQKEWQNTHDEADKERHHESAAILKDIYAEITRYKGIAAGISLVIGFFVTVYVTFKEQIFRLFH